MRATRPRRWDQGAVAVEFVLILPILLLLIFGIIQFSYYFFQLQQGALAAREGARAGAVGEIPAPGMVVGDDSDVDAYIDKWVSSMPADEVTGSACYVDNDASGDLTVGDTLRVTVNFTATNFGLPFVPFPAGGAINQVGDSRVEDLNPYPATGVTCS